MSHTSTIETDKILIQQLDKLKQRYAKDGQNVSCHLERLLCENNLDYSDYLCLDTLLTLQKPKTFFPDEFIFIGYHQIVELYFQLMIWELKQLTNTTDLPTPSAFIEKINRINRYFEFIVASFPIMSDGLDKEQFLKFRYALFPASGFQSLQYRLIEIYATDAINLVSRKWRSHFSGNTPVKELYEKSYWKRGAIDMATNTKSVTLTDFEKKYDAFLLQTINDHRSKNLYRIYLHHYQGGELQDEIVKALRELDDWANVQWPNAHSRVVMKHLGHNGVPTTKSTGGTNWRKYLSPRFQKISFFPQLWSAEELNNWGQAE